MPRENNFVVQERKKKNKNKPQFVRSRNAAEGERLLINIFRTSYSLTCLLLSYKSNILKKNQIAGGARVGFWALHEMCLKEMAGVSSAVLLMHSSSHYFSYLFLHGNTEMAKTGQGPFCEYFCQLTRMCKVLKVFISKCQHHMWVPAHAEWSRSQAGCVRTMESTSCVWNSRKTLNLVRDRLVWCSALRRKFVWCEWEPGCTWIYPGMYLWQIHLPE